MRYAYAWLVLAGLGVLPALAAQERRPGVQRLAFVVEVDCARARDLGWALDGASDGQVVDVAHALVRRRFEAMERAARVELEAGTNRFQVSLPSIDSRDRELFEGMLRSLGVCEFLFVAGEDSARERGIDLAAERAKLEAWRKQHPAAALELFNALTTEEHGPAQGLSCIRYVGWPGATDIVRDCLVLLPDKAEDSFGAASFGRCHASTDPFGYPAIGFDVRPSRKDDFARITEAHVNQDMAFVVEGKLVSSVTLETKLTGGGMIAGRFSAEQTARWVESFQKLEGPLRVLEIR